MRENGGGGMGARDERENWEEEGIPGFLALFPMDIDEIFRIVDVGDW